ncbi:MAG TPA: DUF6015 family protein [Candidatus Thermoplasmatota archaeon]|nr:DUF6015 family protein [Candidatus Thermoplasmatota archaeon]
MQNLPKDLETVTLDLDLDRTTALTDALKERFGMEDEDAMAIAEVVTEQFGDDEEVNDDTLDPEVRSIFYTLEAKRLLTFRREEYSIDTGERRRAFFWRVREEELTKIKDLHHQVAEENVYDTLPKDAWGRRNA